MPFPSPGVTDLQLVKDAFKEIRAQGVDCERDIIKATRLGDTSTGRLGTILVEMRSLETKAQIMKNKKCLENHYSEGLRKLIIKNAQTKSEIKTNIALNEILKRIPGQENNFIAGNGHILSKTSHHANPNTHRFRNPSPPFHPRPMNPYNQVPGFNFSLPPPGLAQTQNVTPPQPQNVVLSQAHGTPIQTQLAGPAIPQYVTAPTQQTFTQSHHNIPAQYQVTHNTHAHAQPPPQGIFQPQVQPPYVPQVPQTLVTEQSVPATAIDTTEFDFSDNPDQHQLQQEGNTFSQGVGHPLVVDNPEQHLGDHA